jgi:hypothetical protein
MLRRKLLQRVLWSGNGPRLAMAVLLMDDGGRTRACADPSTTRVASADTVVWSGCRTSRAALFNGRPVVSAPIALYPDPLLALILSASTFPVQIVEAERWIAFNPISVRRGDFSEVDAMDWDSSVKALARFPDVIRKLADHLDWTESLGTAVAMQASDVTTAIQLLLQRRKLSTISSLLLSKS